MCMKRKVVTLTLDKKTYVVLKQKCATTGVPMSRQIDFHVLGKPAKIKKVGDY